MRRFIAFILAGMALAAVPASAQTIKEAVYADLNKAGGVYYMYEFKEHKVAPPPKGYPPVYLSHYGRHGARYLLNDTQYERSLGVLRAAHEQNALTEVGERIWQEASAYFEEECRFRAGDLTPLGWEQHYRIALETYNANKKFFKKHPVVTAGATQVPRCIVSMAAFCQGLASADPSLQIYEAASKAELDEINPHADENPRRTNVRMEGGRYSRIDLWGTGLKGFIDARIDHRAISGRIFYDLVFNMQCTPTKRSLMWFFTPDECYKLWEINNYIHYMESAPPATRRDMPALMNMIADADSALTAGVPTVRLRFGHDTVFLFLISVFGADGYGIVPSSADEISATWANYRAPMAATLYLLFCKNKAGNVLVKMVVNGEEATLPLEPVTGPWYNWEDLKSLLRSPALAH